jgi:hypothetical protein
MFDRIMTPRFTKDIDETNSYDDVRWIFDGLSEELVAEMDSKFIDTVNDLLVGANKEVPETGRVQWIKHDLPIDRDTITEALCAFDGIPAAVLVNSDFVKHLPTCPDGSGIPEELPESRDGKMRWVVTDKRGIVPDGAMFMFGKPEDLGRSFVLEDVTAHFDRKSYILEFFVHTCMGTTLSDVSQLARVDFKVKEAKRSKKRKK